MKIDSVSLLKELKDLTEQHLNFAEKLLTEPESNLLKRKSPESWNALECIEHLNRYARFYHPEIEKRISQSDSKAEQIFNSGWLGNYFAESMKPKSKLNTMKTFRSMNPIHQELDLTVIREFIGHQNKMLELLDSALVVNLSKIKTAISISPLIKLRLGDTFRVVVYHNQRHVEQAGKAGGN
ncbi:MAG: DinB family protein [Bacteroidetes bacterium]|nr:DinB family protein [Bacteroidota bacterium]